MRTHVSTGASVAFAAFAVALAHAQQFREPVAVRLPGIVHKWGEPDAKSPSTTFQEISQCIGDDVGIRTRVADYESAQAGVQGEIDELNRRTDALSGERQALKNDEARLLRMQADYQPVDRAIKDRDAEIKRMRAKPPASNVEIDRLNAQINEYNGMVVRGNRQLGEIEKVRLAFNERVRTFNDSIDLMDVYVRRFNQKNAVFIEQVSSLNADLETFKTKCAGERVIRKD